MKNVHRINQHIYITSDSEIKDGDWMIRDNEQPIKVTKNFFWDFGVRYYKIILTTDQDLIKDGVQAIDDQFLEWFVKNPSCEEVEAEKNIGRYVDYAGNVHSPISYKIIIPKEETDLDIKDNKIELLEEDLECIRMYLDDLKIPRNDKDGNKYSIVGRIKWQQERMYSEEEVLADITEWFEQFKKK